MLVFICMGIRAEGCVFLGVFAVEPCPSWFQWERWGVCVLRTWPKPVVTTAPTPDLSMGTLHLATVGQASGDC